jgi:hypothetical protein
MSPAAAGISVNANADTDRRSHSDSADHAHNCGHIYGVTCFKLRTHTGFLELRGTLTKTEDGTTIGPYALFRLRKIYQGTFVFGGAKSAQLEEVYYNRKPNQPAYNYRLFFQESSDKAPTYDQLRQRLDAILTGFVHTFDAGYDAWAGSDARGTAVLLSDRDVLGFVEIQVHVAFPTPRW